MHAGYILQSPPAAQTLVEKATHEYRATHRQRCVPIVPAPFQEMGFSLAASCICTLQASRSRENAWATGTPPSEVQEDRSPPPVLCLLTLTPSTFVPGRLVLRVSNTGGNLSRYLWICGGGYGREVTRRGGAEVFGQG